MISWNWHDSLFSTTLDGKPFDFEDLQDTESEEDSQDTEGDEDSQITDSNEDDDTTDDSEDGHASEEHDEDYYTSPEFIKKHVDGWSTRHHFLPSFNPNITHCMTYKAPKEFSGGADSMVE